MKKPLKIQAKTEGSVSELVDQQQHVTSETERALKNNLEELINLKEAMMELVQGVELQLQQITEQLCHEKKDSGNVEAELLEAQEELRRTEREELQRTTATIESERHSRHIHVKDIMTSDYPEPQAGMSSQLCMHTAYLHSLQR